MRALLFGIGWLSVVGSIFDAAIFAFVLWLAATGAAAWSITVDAHLADHLGFVYWVKDVAYWALPDGFVEWIFGLPAAIYYPARMALSMLIGAWAFSEARKRA
ncbi:MAG: hypothetical protein GC152_02060 [Alphaproteobacteria bacterium]|nr:hypothetical protein [Alphaproteobacteria bacterium]